MRPVNLLSKKDMDAIHLASLDVLQEVGIVVPSEEVLRKLDEVGAEVDYGKQHVRIPHNIAEEAIRKTPHRFSIYYRDLKTRKILGGDKTHFGTVGFATNFYDVASRTYRRTTTQDLANATRIADALENVDFYMCMGSPMDVPHEIVDRYMWMLSFENTRKPVINEAMRKEGAVDAIEMASTIAGGMEALAGTLTLNMAEFISALVISRSINSKAPIIIGSWARAMDVRSASAVLGGPEFALLHAAVAQMAHYYEIPSAGGGILSDSKSLDAQMGYEKALTGIIPAFAGLNLICGMGLIASENTMSPEGLVIDNEIVSMAKKIITGIEVTDETVALDLIKKVGPGGSFITERHTLEHFKKEIWIPKITDRTFPDAWVKAGARDLWVKAKEEVEKILKEYEVPQLSNDIKAKIMEIAERARGGG